MPAEPTTSVTTASTTINFELGLPDPDMFPWKVFSEEITRSLSCPGRSLLYGGPGRLGIALGHEGLRLAVQERRRPGDPDPDGLMVTSGAAQAVELVLRRLLSTDDAVFAVEAPTWGGALRLGRSLGAEAVPVPVDRDGLRLDVLESHLSALREAGRRLRLLYTISTFHTPTGTTLSLSRRRRLLELAAEHDFVVVDDRVYADLRFSGEVLPSLSSLDGDGRVVEIGSFSKTIAPALRLGWLAAAPSFVAEVGRAREDLGSSRLMSDVVERMLRSGVFDRHLEAVRENYRAKRDVVVEVLRHRCGDLVTFDIPRGGMFLWLELAAEVDGRAVAEEAHHRGVICRPGDTFFGDGGGHHQWMRMAYTMPPVQEVLRGADVLADVVTESRSGRVSGGA